MVSDRHHLEKCKKRSDAPAGAAEGRRSAFLLGEISCHCGGNM